MKRTFTFLLLISAILICFAKAQVESIEYPNNTIYEQFGKPASSAHKLTKRSPDGGKCKAYEVTINALIGYFQGKELNDGSINYSTSGCSDDERNLLNRTDKFIQRCNLKEKEEECKALFDDVLRKTRSLGKLNYEEMLELISKAYKKNVGAEKILEFIEGFTSQTNVANGYKALLSQMRSKGDKSVFFFEIHILKAIESKRDEFDEIGNEVLDAVLKECTIIIKRKDKSGMINITNKLNGTIGRISDQLVEMVYDENAAAESVDQLAAFAEILTQIEDYVNVTEAVHKRIKQSNPGELRPWLNYLLHLKRVRMVPNSREGTKEICEKIWEDSPIALKAIVENQLVCIENADLNLQLYVKNHFDDHRDRVMATRSETPKISSKWKFEWQSSGASFEIRSWKSDEGMGDYLYAGADFFAISEDKRRLFTWRGGESVMNMKHNQGEWVLGDSKWQDNIFTIYDKNTNEYLNADVETESKFVSTEFDTNNAFTWRKKDDSQGPYPYWRIKMC